MRAFAVLLLLVCFLPAAARAQGSGEGFTPPPLVDVPTGDEPEPPPSSTGAQEDGTGTYQPRPGHSPLFGVPARPPPPEVGLMVTESLFGMLTAAGTGLLGYYLLVKPLSQSGAVDPAVGNLIFVLTFASVPMTVAQTQVNLANGSRYYSSESWPAYLTALGAQAAAIGGFYAFGGVNGEHGERVLLIGTVVGVPLVTMAVINLTKQPKRATVRRGSLVGHAPGDGFALGVPIPSLVPVRTAGGFDLGVQVPLASGSF